MANEKQFKLTPAQMRTLKAMSADHNDGIEWTDGYGTKQTRAALLTRELIEVNIHLGYSPTFKLTDAGRTALNGVSNS